MAVGVSAPAGVRFHRGAVARIATSLLGAEAFVLGRRVFLSESAAETIRRGGADARRLLGHELAHVEQFRRLGAAAFLTRYVLEYVRARARGASRSEAYSAIGFEREAERQASAASDQTCGAPMIGDHRT